MRFQAVDKGGGSIRDVDQPIETCRRRQKAARRVIMTTAGGDTHDYAHTYRAEELILSVPIEK